MGSRGCRRRMADCAASGIDDDDIYIPSPYILD